MRMRVFTAVALSGIAGCAGTPFLGPGPDMDETEPDVPLRALGAASAPVIAAPNDAPAPATGGGAGEVPLDTDDQLSEDEGLAERDSELLDDGPGTAEEAPGMADDDLGLAGDEGVGANEDGTGLIEGDEPGLIDGDEGVPD